MYVSHESHPGGSDYPTTWIAAAADTMLGRTVPASPSRGKPENVLPPEVLGPAREIGGSIDPPAVHIFLNALQRLTYNILSDFLPSIGPWG